MEQYLPLILSAIGGTVLGPVISKLTGGSGTGGIIGGILGGIAAHYGLDAGLSRIAFFILRRLARRPGFRARRA